MGFDVSGSRMDLWLSHPDSSIERRSSAQDWAPGPVNLPAVTWAFGLDRDGEPLAASSVGVGADGWSLMLDGAPVYTASGAAPRSLWLAQDPGRFEEAAPRAVVMTGEPETLRLHRPGNSDLALPDTGRAPWSCPDLQCDESCFEDGSGRLGDSAALGRTADATIWGAYVHVELSLLLVQEPPDMCASVGSCECQREIGRNETDVELRLVGVRPDNTVMPSVTLTDLDLQVHGSEFDTVLEMSASANRLVIVTHAGRDGLRVLMVDPSVVN